MNVGVFDFGVIEVRASQVGARQSRDDSSNPTKLSFNRDIRPILSDKCFHCHGPDESSREAGLRFDLHDDAMSMITPGDPDNSELYSRISDEDPDVVMPPPEINKPLTDEEIATLKQWIDEGASWSAFWAYEPPIAHPIPEFNNADYSNWIDRFVVDRLQKNGLQLSPAADRVTLIRRVYFDLIGLPPTPSQVSDFVNDQSEGAFVRVVDQLLASQHFGERLAIYWLDLVRYADTVGYHGDQDHNISPYRDWVINGFNSNMPLDQFTREQLAGDLLPAATESQKIASGYNRLLQTTHEGGLQPKEYSAIYAADRVRNVSLVWMGATVGCAQCHDHKYDPYTAKDFYSLAAFFADIDDEKHFRVGTNALPTKRPPELLVLSDADRPLYESAKANVAAAEKLVRQRKAELASATQASEREPEAAEQRSGDQSDVKLDQLAQLLKSAEQKLQRQRQAVSAIERRGAWSMITRALDQPRVTRLLPRGNWLDESGPIVEPAIPEFLGALKTENARANRLDLANWLVDVENGNGKLTARVFANRFWYLMMGVGLSRSLDDFGGQGEPPEFPELLDQLALEFVKHDWDIKWLVRQIVTSQTYQQASLESDAVRELDPYNQLFSHQSRFRLPAEMIRDNALAISGLLNCETIGGKSIKPMQPGGYYQHLNFPKRKYAHHQDARQWRRGVYVHWQRQFLHPSMKAFDAPSREECTAQRPKSNTPSAALALLNDPIFVEAARNFAQRILREPEQSFDARIEFAFQVAVSRMPRAGEVKILRQLLDIAVEDMETDHAARDALLAIGDSPLDQSLDATELAAWTTLARAILNLNETLTRN